MSVVFRPAAVLPGYVLMVFRRRCKVQNVGRVFCTRHRFKGLRLPSTWFFKLFSKNAPAHAIISSHGPSRHRERRRSRQRVTFAYDYARRTTTCSTVRERGGGDSVQRATRWRDNRRVIISARDQWRLGGGGRENN